MARPALIPEMTATQGYRYLPALLFLSPFFGIKLDLEIPSVEFEIVYPETISINRYVDSKSPLVLHRPSNIHHEYLASAIRILTLSTGDHQYADQLK